MTVDPEQAGGYHAIRPDTEVLGGVFFGRHAILVDFEENPAPYERAYEMAGNLLARSARPSPMEIVSAVNRVVTSEMPFSRKKAGKALQTEADVRGVDRIEQEEVINLSRFMGGGTCNHQTLFAGSLLRLLQERRDIGGRVSIEPPLPTRYQTLAVHSWVRYARDGQRIIYDPGITSRIFRLEPALLKTKDQKYLRPDDLEEFTEADTVRAGAA